MAEKADPARVTADE
ncbi:hypothetical protein NPS65_21870 [Escherichia coli]|nr:MULTISPECIES: hypothetical protein [Escherichia]MCF6485767.1 hypothetical protein [Escherichia coli]MCP8803606.1 hypothetical protein [Escherichia coli]MCP9631790.1 hypothetical protein [Escherichia coli]MCQ6891798.1 hypothetical protein [Escherichia coli]MCU6840343.1 hypothetical protein [Escherichia coli]